MMIQRRGFAALFFCSIVPGALAQPSRGLPEGKLAEIEKRITAEMARQNIPGLSIAVGLGGELRWASGYGMSDLENFVPAKASTIYRLASISKPVTAVAVMQLVEAGKLKLDAPVREYVPSFPEKQAPITIRQLLCHQGGIRHYRGGAEIVSTRHYTDMLDAVRQFQDDPLVAEPGTKYSYTTFGYVLLGAAVEAASGIPFMDYVREKIALPAGAEMLAADDTFALIPNRARGYAKGPGGRVRNCRLADTSNKTPGGGMCSRAEDLVRFAQALQKGKLLERETLGQMWTAQATRDGAKTGYGLGWSVSESDGRKRVAHSGGQPGTATILVTYPAEQVTVAIMCNLEGARPSGLAFDIAQLLLP